MLRLLVVDDNSNDVELLRMCLEPLTPVEITAVSTAGAATEMLEASGFPPARLVLIDWRLPDADGEALALRFVRHPQRPPRIPIVLLSSVVPMDLENRLRDAGAVALTKPIDLNGYDELAARLLSLTAESTATHG